MAATPASSLRRQFSLRAFLTLVAVAAATCAVWRMGGPEAALGLTLAATCIGTSIVAPWATRRAYVLAWGAVYGPFLAMACYASLRVACNHCQGTSWTLLPGGPGIVVAEAARYAMRVPPSFEVRFAGGFLVSCLAVAALALVGAKRPRSGAIAAAAVCVASSVAAAIVLAAIRA